MKKIFYYFTFLFCSINSFSQPIGNFDGLLNTTNVFEKILDIPSFPNGGTNLAVDFSIGNISFWGYIELEITGSYNYQLTPGRLTKTFAIGVNPDGNIYQNESRVNDALGSIANNIAIGEFKYDAVRNRFVIPISHIVSTMNGYTLKVKAFSYGGGASNLVNSISISNQYTLSALPKNQVYFNGNVGIGNSNPQVKLHLGNSSFLLNSNYSPNYNADLFSSNGIVVADGKTISYSNTYEVHGYSKYDANSYSAEGRMIHYGYYGLSFATRQGLGLILTGDNNFVGIGTANPTEKLSVNGNIRAKKLIITQTSWSDYVFGKNFKLRTLSEVENYIKANQHLPDVPSAKEVAAKGISVGDNQAILLKKIEELTLYIIELEKKIIRLENKSK